MSETGKPSASPGGRANSEKTEGCGAASSADMIRVLRCALAYAVMRRFTTMSSCGFSIGHPSHIRGLTPWTFRRSAVELHDGRRRCSRSAWSR